MADLKLSKLSQEDDASILQKIRAICDELEIQSLYHAPDEKLPFPMLALAMYETESQVPLQINVAVTPNTQDSLQQNRLLQLSVIWSRADMTQTIQEVNTFVTQANLLLTFGHIAVFPQEIWYRYTLPLSDYADLMAAVEMISLFGVIGIQCDGILNRLLSAQIDAEQAIHAFFPQTT